MARAKSESRATRTQPPARGSAGPSSETLAGQHQAVVAELSQRALSGIWLTTLSEEVVALVARTLGAQRCEILEHMSGSGSGRLRSTAYWKDGEVRSGGRAGPVAAHAAAALEADEALWSEDLGRETRFDGASIVAEEGVRSGVAVVIPGIERRLGVIAVHWGQRRRPSARDLLFLRAVANVLGAAIERKRAETALQKSEREFREIFEHMHDVFCRVDMNGTVLMVNPSVARYGYRPEELCGKPAWLLFGNEEERRRFFHVLLERSSVTDLESTLVTADGKRVPVSVNARLIVDAFGRAVAVEGIVRDMTERHRAQAEIRALNAELQRRIVELQETQQRLIHAERVKALGVIAAGIAHELNNPMMGILNQVEYALEKVREDERLRGVLGEALANTRRCIRIISDLLTHARKDTGPSDRDGSGDVLGAVRSGLHLCRETIQRTGVCVTLGAPRSTPPVSLSQGRIEQIVVNLVTNACHAMQDRPRRELRLAVEVQPDHVLLTVSDTGTGMDEETRQRIFEPFYTTKSPGSGTGLGLSLCRNLIESVGGRIEVESKVDEGTTFAISLPRASQKPRGECDEATVDHR